MVTPVTDDTHSGLTVDALRFERAGTMVLDIAHFGLMPGAQAVVVGPSGCGKTTLLSLLAGLLPIQQGRILIGGVSLNELAQRGARAVDGFRARHIGLVPQHPLLFGMLSALDNLLLAQRLAGGQTDRDAARKLLTELGLAGLEHRRPAQLSRGQQQRVALARALVNRPALLLADEPTANLDDAQAAQAIDLLRERAQSLGAVLLIATHDARVRDAFDTVLTLERR
jgi:putative ABC transport system ATP-binding protein